MCPGSESPERLAQCTRYIGNRFPSISKPHLSTTLGIPTRNHSFSNNFPKLSTAVRQGGAGVFRLGRRGGCDRQEAQGHGKATHDAL